MRLIDADKLWKDTTSTIDVCEDFLELIEKQPTVDRPQGEWIEVDEPIMGNPYCRYRCSECSLEEPYIRDFCPNCGARMKGASDDETYKCGRAVAKCT